MARKLNPSCIQKEARSHIYTGRTIPHLYRKDDPTSIQRDRSHPYKGRSRSHMYTGENSIPHVYRENDPTCIQKEPSWALNEVTID